MLVSGLRGYHVIDVGCGSGDAHSLAVADDGKNLYTLVSSPLYVVVIDVENSLKFQNNYFFAKILMKVSAVQKNCHAYLEVWVKLLLLSKKRFYYLGMAQIE